MRKEGKEEKEEWAKGRGIFVSTVRTNHHKTHFCKYYVIICVVCNLI